MHGQHYTVDDFGNQVPTCRGGLRCLAAFACHCGGVLSLMAGLCADI
jgi:hypothetical protein